MKRIGRRHLVNFRKIQNLFIPVALLFAGLITSSFTTYNSDLQCPDGVYETYEDYLSGKLADYGKLKRENTLLTQTSIVFIKDDQKTVFKLNDVKFWGIKQWCIDCRISKGNIFKIIVAGNVTLYGYGNVRINSDDTTRVKSFNVVMPGALFYLSKGPNGELVKWNDRNLESMIADDQEIVTRAKENKWPKLVTDEKLNVYYNNLAALISQYNAKHPL